MKHLRTFILSAFAAVSMPIMAQFDNSGIAAGFFDSSENSTLNFSEFHLPPLSVLFENAKATPQILSLAKAHELALAEVAKEKRHIFSYVSGHASYSYGKTDVWGNNSSTYNTTIYQFQGSEQNYWNVGVSVSVPLEDILDLTAAVKRKRIEAEQARIEKDIAYDNLKLEIATLYIKITNDLVTLKTASENAAIYQGAGALNEEEFHNGNMSIRDFAETKRYENSAVSTYQSLQTEVITDIITLEIMTHTPILTNTTTEITLDDTETKTAKEIAKENKQLHKQINKQTAAEEKRYEEMEKADLKQQKQAEKEAERASKRNK